MYRCSVSVKEFSDFSILSVTVALRYSTNSLRIMNAELSFADQTVNLFAPIFLFRLIEFRVFDQLIGARCSVGYKQLTAELQFHRTSRFIFCCYIDFCLGRGKNPVERCFSIFRIAMTFTCLQQ